MASIVTETLKQELIQPVLKNITTGVSPSFYLGLSKSQSWGNGGDLAPAPRQDVDEENDFRKGLQSIIKINSASLVVKRQNWTSGVSYAQYDDERTMNQYDSDGIPYYVMTDAQDVYICLVTGRNSVGATVPSTIKPTGQNNHVIGTSDGYRWKFLYSVSPLEANYYMTQDWMPIRHIESVDSNSTGAENKQYAIQQTARRSEITSFIVDSGGLNYTDSCRVQVNGVLDGNILVTTSGGVIKKVMFASDSSTFHTQDDLDGAILTTIHATGSTASIRPVFSNARGIGANASVDLRAKSIMINSKITGNQTDFITGQDFRQIGIMKNLKDSHGSTGKHFNSNSGNTLYQMKVTPSVGFTKDRYVVGATSGARAFLDNVVDSNLFYHQFDSTGYVSFVDGETVNEDGGSGSGVISSNSSKIKPEVHPRSGDVLYIDNRAAVARVANQTEDIKIVIKLDNCT